MIYLNKNLVKGEKMSIINKIGKELTQSKYLKVAIFNKNDVVFYLWEREIPVCVNPINGSIFIDVEGYDWKLQKDMLDEIVVVMAVIEENMDEVRGWVKEWE
jgi:hypothetical protein